MSTDLTVVIPARHEEENLRLLLPMLHRTLQALSITYEILVVDGGAGDSTTQIVEALGGRVITQRLPGYGNALKEGFQTAQGTYVLTMDADLSHEPRFIYKLWASRDQADLVIASRYVRGGVAYMPAWRKALSRVLNRVFTKGLSMDVRDISSGFRLYRTAVVRSLDVSGTHFDVLPELAVRAHIGGWRILEVPFTYFPRVHGSSQARILLVGAHLMKTFTRLWGLRNSIQAADYDERAFYSLVPVQRWWQRKRHRIITMFARDTGLTLDVGCGSSVILQSLNHAVGIEIRHEKMRYMRRYGVPLVTGSVFSLPFVNDAVECVICSEVIEHIPPDPQIFVELDRVLRPGGLLILGTPDYATWAWPLIEAIYHRLMPGGYADEHISHYTRRGLLGLLDAMGYQLVGERSIGRGELILCARKGERAIRPEALGPFLPMLALGQGAERAGADHASPP